jgi:hypothetical protein
MELKRPDNVFAAALKKKDVRRYDYFDISSSHVCIVSLAKRRYDLSALDGIGERRERFDGPGRCE